MNLNPPDLADAAAGDNAEAGFTPCPPPDSTDPFPPDARNLRTLEGQLRMAERLAAYGQLAAEAVHEISNLTTIVLFNAELQRESQAREGRVDRFVGPMLRAATLVCGLCRQLRNLAHPEAPEPRVVDLGQVVGEIAQLLKQVVGREFAFACEAGRPLWVRVDPAGINQVLINLVLNARDATPEDGGRVAIRVGVLAGGAPRREWRFIDVTDNGHGIAPEVRRQLFQPFFTTKPVGQGTGLGLVMVQRLVEEMRGHLELASAPGEGTRFRLLLPPCDAPPSPAPDAGEGPGALRRRAD